jgi:hypothetical protein
MTIRVPPENLLDKVLKLLGKERRVILPKKADKIYKDLGPHVQIKGKRESFLKAFLRKKDKGK